MLCTYLLNLFKNCLLYQNIINYFVSLRYEDDTMWEYVSIEKVERYRGRNENIDNFFWKYRQFFLKISTNFFENIDKLFWKYRQIFLKISTNYFENIDKFFWKYRQIFLKISTNFFENIDNFFNKYNLAYWFYICDLALKIVFWLK